MARIPCSFSAQEDFLASIDRRANELGMKRSEFIVHALKKELMREGQSFVVVAEQSGSNNSQKIFSDAQGAPAPGQKYPKKSRARKKPEK
jgi:hypothetical protein